MNNKPRVAVFGIDGATLDVIEPMAKAGELPAFSRILSEGFCGSMQTTYPPLTAPAWTSLMTGLQPRNHGMFDFFERRPGTYDRKLVYPSHHGVTTLWRHLSRHDRKSYVINVPMTYPPEEINGELIGGFGTPLDATFTYPTSLSASLRKSGYRIRPRRIYCSPGKERQFIADAQAVEEIQTRTALEYFDRNDWDFFMYVMMSVDMLSHFFWKDMDPQDPRHDPASPFLETIRDAYRRADNLLGQLMDRTDSRTTLMVVSDHGFGPVHYEFNVNAWLAQHGFLRYREEKVSLRRGIRDRVVRAVKHLDILRLRRLLPHKYLEGVQAEAPWHTHIDWQNTRAYGANVVGSIYANRKGREPEGIVGPGEAEQALREEIIRDLKHLTHNGRQLRVDVRERDESGNGRFSDAAPDIDFVIDDFTYLPRSKVRANQIFSASPAEASGTHRMEATLCMFGNGIAAGSPETAPKIVDIFPTVHYLLDLPLAANLDGKLLAGAIAPELLRSRPPKGGGTATTVETANTSLSGDQEEDLKDWLRGLGYIK